MLLPCNVKETALVKTLKEDRIPENCNRNRTKLIDYLGPVEMFIYSNVGSFQHSKYGNDRVKKESSITKFLVD